MSLLLIPFAGSHVGWSRGDPRGGSLARNSALAPNRWLVCVSVNVDKPTIN